jgi:hypothetical protein
MKMLSVLFLALTFNAFASTASNNTLDAAGAVKTRAISTLAVVNGASTAITKGMAVCFDLTDDNAVQVDLCYAEGAKPVGVVMDTSCAVGARCTLLTKGFFAAGKFDYAATATVAGGMIYADTDGDLTRPSTVTVAMFPVGTTFDAVSADATTLEIYVDL